MPGSPWEKLKDRKVVQWAVAYAAIGWLLLQIVDLFSDTFDWPPAVLKGLTYLLASGVIPVLILAWFHGERGAQRSSAVEYSALGAYAILVAIAMWLFLDDSRKSSAFRESDAFNIEIISVDPPVSTVLTNDHFDPHIAVAVAVSYSFDSSLVDISPNEKVTLNLGAVYDESENNNFNMTIADSKSISMFPLQTTLRGNFGSDLVGDGVLMLQVTAMVQKSDESMTSIGAPIRIEYQAPGL